MNIGRCP